MRIGVPTEIKPFEKRVGLVADSVRELTARGHDVVVQSGAGLGIGQDDAAYRAAGARILPDAAAVFETADMIVKVKEPQPAECAMLRRDQILFAYLHLAPDPEQARGLIASGCTAIAYETVTDGRGGLPLLAPMSEVAGRMATQVAARLMENVAGGAGLLIGGVPGVEPAKLVILGGGVAGSNALAVAVGMGADVVVIDRDAQRLRALDAQYGNTVKTVYATAAAIERHVTTADAVIGTVLIPGAAAPKLITRALVRAMKPGAVVVDVAVDQGGCAETARPTTHDAPTYVVDDVVHYCVANMPGGVARTSAFALNNATLPFVLALADEGIDGALADDPHLLDGLNVRDGAITHAAVARDLGLAHRPATEAVRLPRAA
jgi:alanine dehydrogenase